MDGNEWKCAICLSSEEKDCYILEPCKHKFHAKCLIESLRKCNSKCPYCRGTDPSKIENNFMQPNLIRDLDDLNDLNILQEILNDDYSLIFEDEGEVQISN